MGDTLIPPSLLFTKMLPLGALSMRSMERMLFQAITTQFSHHLLENLIFSHFSPFVPAYIVGTPMTQSQLLLTKMLSLGAVAMKSGKRKLLQAITTPFSHHLPEN